MKFLEYLKNNILYLDGGMGTLLQAEGLQPGEHPERWNYEQIMFTGGEPLLYPSNVDRLANSIKDIVSIQYGYTPKIYVYTAVCDSMYLYIGLKSLDGVVLTPHNERDVNRFLLFNESLVKLGIL